MTRIALVTSAFVGLKGMTNSLAGEVEQWADEAVIDKVFVRNMPAADFAEFAQHFLVEAASHPSGVDEFVAVILCRQQCCKFRFGTVLVAITCDHEVIVMARRNLAPIIGAT